MIKEIIRRARDHFAAISATLLVPASGIWFTYWERDHSNRSYLRSQYAEETKRHKEFIEDVSDRLLKGEFEYLKLHEANDAFEFRQSIELEARRLGRNPSDIKALSLMSAKKPSDNIHASPLSEVYGAKLNLILESLRGGMPLSPSSLVSSGSLARETLQFLRRSNLLNYGGLWMEADLSGLDLQNSNLSCTYLDDLKLDRTDLSNSNLAAIFMRTVTRSSGVNLSGARLLAAQLHDSWFVGSNFSRANMQIASLKGSTLQDSDFSLADLRDTTFYGARILEGNRFDGADLRGAVLLVDEKNSLPGKIFKGAYGNSRPYRNRDGHYIPATKTPKDLSLADLGIIDISEKDTDVLRKAGTRNGEESRAIRLPSSCKWKIDGAVAQLELHRMAASYKPE